MRRRLRPAPPTMSTSERAAERRFVARVLRWTIGLHLAAGALALVTLPMRMMGTRPRPRLDAPPPAPSRR